MKYLFNDWAKIKRKIGDSSLFMFLDFDGTLAPIAPTPEKAFLAKATRVLLRKISQNTRIKLAIISGRQLNDIKKKIGIKDIIYSGNHGLELESHGIDFKPPITSAYLAALCRIKDELRRKTSRIPGVFLEDKGLTISLHYRAVSRQHIGFVKNIFWDAVLYDLAGHTVKTGQGKMVLEVRPPIEWGKGSIVSLLLAKGSFWPKKRKVIPAYIGDDTTDEDAFRAVRKNGIAVFAGRPKKSYAQYYLKGHGEVRKFLERVLALYNE